MLDAATDVGLVLLVRQRGTDVTHRVKVVGLDIAAVHALEDGREFCIIGRLVVCNKACHRKLVVEMVKDDDVLV